MRGIGRFLRTFFRRPERPFGCLVFFLGGFSLATWPLASVGPIIALITLLTIVTGLTLFWRDAGWFQRLWVGGLMLSVAAAVIALLNPNTSQGTLFQVVAGLALLPSLIAAIGYARRQWRDRGVVQSPHISSPSALTDLPPPLPWKAPTKIDPSTLPHRQVPLPAELPPPLPRQKIPAATDLLNQLLNTPPEK